MTDGQRTIMAEDSRRASSVSRDHKRLCKSRWGHTDPNKERLSPTQDCSPQPDHFLSAVIETETGGTSAIAIAASDKRQM